MLQQRLALQLHTGRLPHGSESGVFVAFRLLLGAVAVQGGEGEEGPEHGFGGRRAVGEGHADECAAEGCCALADDAEGVNDDEVDCSC
jgi:hypothetical protein